MQQYSYKGQPQDVIGYGSSAVPFLVVKCHGHVAVPHILQRLETHNVDWHFNIADVGLRIFQDTEGYRRVQPSMLPTDDWHNLQRAICASRFVASWLTGRFGKVDLTISDEFQDGVYALEAACSFKHPNWQMLTYVLLAFCETLGGDMYKYRELAKALRFMPYDQSAAAQAHVHLRDAQFSLCSDISLYAKQKVARLLWALPQMNLPE
jgi:hypothetical protein